MQLCKHTNAAGVLSARAPVLPLRASACTGVRVQRQDSRNVTSSAGPSDEIYIGFPKGDYAPREGRKGRVIRDDPKKYPNKEDMGPLTGVTGGWAGGEAALVQYREALLNDLKAQEKAAEKARASQKYAPPSGSPKPGQQPIYVGFGKEEDDFKRKAAGQRGRVVFDDAIKYPKKEDVGPLAGATGGFAGGERGVKAFVQTGEVRLRKAGEPGGQPMSPLTTAFLVLFAGGFAAVLLSQISPDILEQTVGLGEFELSMAVGGAALLAVAGGIIGFRAISSSVNAQK